MVGTLLRGPSLIFRSVGFLPSGLKQAQLHQARPPLGGMLVGIGAKPKRLLIKLQSGGKPVCPESRLSRLYGFLGSLPAEKLEIRSLRGEVSGLCAFRAIVPRYAWPR